MDVPQVMNDKINPGPPRQARFGPCLDSGFQYTLIRSNRSKKIRGRMLDLAWLKFAVEALPKNKRERQNFLLRFSDLYLAIPAQLF